MSMLKNCLGLQDVIDKQKFTEGRLPIQDTACAELMPQYPLIVGLSLEHQIPLSQPFLDVMVRSDAHKVCKDILGHTI